MARPSTKPFLVPVSNDWEFSDTVFRYMRRQEIIPIVDLLPFCVPDWIGNFQNNDFPELFASLCSSLCQTLPWVQLYTPINEMYICALFSAYYGWWNEQLTTDRSLLLRSR